MSTSVSGFLMQNFSIVSLLVAGFAFYKWHVSQMQREVEFLHTLIRRLRNSATSEILQLLEYGEEWYRVDFHGGDLEKKVDMLLMECTYLCHLQRTRMITRKTFQFFKYDLSVVLSNHDMLNYLYNLYHYSQSARKEFPFIHLIEYGFQKKLIDKDVFLNPTAWTDERFGLCRYLNF